MSRGGGNPSGEISPLLPLEPGAPPTIDTLHTVVAHKSSQNFEPCGKDAKIQFKFNIRGKTLHMSIPAANYSRII